MNARSTPLAAPIISIRNYAIVTAAYWAFTLTDGALRMLVLLHFNQLGYTPVQLAFLFLLYEFFGIVTNLVGGWVASRTGVRFTLVVGLALQVVALGLLALLNRDWSMRLSVAYVMACQALSGIAKDLTKMSAKSAVKVLVPRGDESGLFKWVAALTGSKNALKGAGFFVGGVLLSAFGFRGALAAMASGVLVVLLFVLSALPSAIGQAKKKAKFAGILSNSAGINRLSLARLALFAARDVWFVVSVPIFLASVLGWSFAQVGGFMALWVIAYGGVQGIAPVLLGRATGGRAPGPALAATLGLGLAAVTALIPLALASGVAPAVAILGGLVLFGIVFALNSSVHSYLVLAYSEADRVSLSVGFYYMANACGRLLGTLLSGVLYQVAGVSASLWGAVVLAAAAGICAMFLPPATAEVGWAGAQGDD
ncbi:MAG TPA: organoarsenical effux MFS transporter ArsJ [Vicinamibacterales bacterium]|nr:organoarsenical effux MFS transporter ArsJ [Vicinamibacterales bacterium]